MDKIDGNLVNLKTVRRALRDWDLLSMLGESPLTEMGIVLTRLRQAGYRLTTAGRGLALRDQLQAAIDLIKPDDSPPKPHEKRWRPYLIITEQYLNGRNPEFVQEKLHVSRGTYFEEQNRALDMLSNILLRMEEENQGLQKLKWPIQAEHLELKSQTPFLVPFCPTYSLVGRASIIGTLKQSLLDPKTLSILALCGLPGAGKTRIAIELAYDSQIREHFCDGILWAGLGRQPDVLALLGIWAAAVGLPADTISHCHNLVERTELIHAAIGMRHMLLILDDAWEAEAAFTFKVGGPNCAYLVTTRHMDLAVDFAGENVLVIRELEQNDGLELLIQIAPRTIEAGVDEAIKLVRSVGGLPLALIVMGRYLQKQSYGAQTRRLKHALDRLKAGEARLNLTQAQSLLELNPGFQPDIPFSLKTVIGMSDLALDEATHQALVNLALFPPKPNSFSEEAALAVLASPVEVLDTLVDCGLVEAVKPDRYSLHQTIADYSSLFGSDSNAVDRMLDYFVRFTETHTEHFETLELEFYNIQAALAFANQSNQYKSLISLVSALYSFLETRGLFMMCEQQLSRVYQIGETLGDQEERAFILHWLGSFAAKRGRLKEANGFLQQSLLLAQAASTQVLEGQNQYYLYYFRPSLTDEVNTQNPEPQNQPMLYYFRPSLTDEEKTQNPEPQNQPILYYFRPSLTDEVKTQNPEPQNLFTLYGVRSPSLAREARTRALKGHNFFDLGITRMYMGYFTEGCAHMQSSLQIYSELQMHQEEGLALNALGYAHQEMCDYQRSRKYLERALHICHESRNQRGEGWAHQNLSTVYLATGDFQQAMEQSEKCLSIYSKIGDKRGRGWQIYHLGRIQRQMGNCEEATRSFQEAYSILTEIGDWMGQGFAIQILGLSKVESGEADQAADYYDQALEIFQKIDCKSGIAHYYRNMGVLRRKYKDDAGALPYLKRALDLAREIMFQRGLCATLADLGLVYLHLGEESLALEHGQNAVQIAQNIGARPTLARAWLYLGNIFLEVERIEDAESAYQQSLNLRNKLGQKHLIAEPLTGLAEAAYVRGNMNEAKTYAVKVAEYLGNSWHPEDAYPKLAGSDRPDHVLQICGKILGTT
jgi:tetratricopeptide (TPR) repeat protein